MIANLCNLTYTVLLHLIIYYQINVSIKICYLLCMTKCILYTSNHNTLLMSKKQCKY